MMVRYTCLQNLEDSMLMTLAETGGFGDHVTPFHSPKNTPGEWMQDPLGLFGDIFVGPGMC